MKIKFTILGEPQGKGRPRFANINGKAITHTPDETVMYENLVVTEYRRQCGSTRFADKESLALKIRAFYSIPASASKKKQKQMEEGELRPTKKPDWDNVGKIIADSLNQIAYRDDAQIVESQVQKYYSRQPRVEVTLQNVQPK